MKDVLTQTSDELYLEMAERKLKGKPGSISEEAAIEMHRTLITIAEQAKSQKNDHLHKRAVDALGELRLSHHINGLFI